ncbi:hypothetical protein DOTSEDRAFT_37712 [Dothistroma septosporum NZE10]|uniref:Uncharacterized protein n=1 Tax=Dothistroma septosporum (strain NZE10 / CBS 128990) TaxID=675120 RepID=N1PHG3_DOTSN|nr:hypothetical protein DOTSEDRAFT_37712 [Dothistroma septosporum NZE10]
MTTSTVDSRSCHTPESAASPPNGSDVSHVHGASSRTRATSSNSYFNISWSQALAGLPPALPISHSSITLQPITLSAPPSGLLYKRRLWNVETDHGRLCDPDGSQGSMENQQRMEEQWEINEEWLEERGLEPLDVSAFRKIEWKQGATMVEVAVSPRTVVLKNSWTQAVEAHGSLNNARRHHARMQANQEWIKGRGESPISVDTFTAMDWYAGPKDWEQGVSTSPRDTTRELKESSSIRYIRSTSTSSNGVKQYPHTLISSTTDSLSSFADLINEYNADLANIGEFSSFSIGRTQYPYPSSIPSPSLTSDTDAGSVIYEDEIVPVLQTASLALVISPRSSKASMLSAGQACQARRSPRLSETPMQEAERLVDIHATQAGHRGPRSPEVRLVIVRGRAVPQSGSDGSGWSLESLLRTPTVADHQECAWWAKTKNVFEKLNCRGRK